MYSVSEEIERTKLQIVPIWLYLHLQPSYLGYRRNWYTLYMSLHVGVLFAKLIW